MLLKGSPGTSMCSGVEKVKQRDPKKRQQRSAREAYEPTQRQLTSPHPEEVS